MNVLAIAGASFPCGVSDLARVVHRRGYDPVLLDHPHNAAKTDPGLPGVQFGTGLPDDLAAAQGLLLPLLESWVTEGVKLPMTANLAFDRRAGRISRSKISLSECLLAAGVAAVERRRVETVGDALREADSVGYPVVLRGDTGYTGHGVWVADSPNQLRTTWEEQSKEREEAGYAEMRGVMGVEADMLVLEPWLDGDEWSVDCIIARSRSSIIRVSQKATVVVDGRPVTLGYRLATEAGILAEVEEAVSCWSRAIFAPGVISFACFDFRRGAEGRFVPLDFGAALVGMSTPSSSAGLAELSTPMPQHWNRPWQTTQGSWLHCKLGPRSSTHLPAKKAYSTG